MIFSYLVLLLLTYISYYHLMRNICNNSETSAVGNLSDINNRRPIHLLSQGREIFHTERQRCAHVEFS